MLGRKAGHCVVMVAVVALVGGLASGGLLEYQAAVNAEGALVSYYTFDSDTTAATDTANGNHGTLIGTTAWGGGAGGAGQSLSLGGAGHVNLGNVTPFNFDDGTGTVEAWVSRGWTAGPGYNPCIVSSREGGPVRWSIHANQGSGRIEQWTGTWRAYETTLNPNQWDHVVSVYSGGNCTVYHNGVSIGTQGLPLGTPAHPTEIGSSDQDADGAERWIGRLDEVAIYSDALTASAVQAHYRAMVPPGITGWWRMEDVSGTTAADSSGKGRDGTLVNFADTSAGAGNTTQSGWADEIVSPLTDRGTTLANDGSLRLDGSNDYVQTTHHVPRDSFTLEAIVTHENPSAGWGWPFGETAGPIFVFGKQSGSGNLHYNIDGLSGGYQVALPYGQSVADGNPHHIALAFDNNRNALVTYFDHQPVNVRYGMAGAPNGTADFFIGRRGNGEYWDGKVDEARVWDMPVTAPQMLNGPPAPPMRLGERFSDDFEGGNTGWNYMQSAGSDVAIIPEPGNPANNVLQLVSATNDRATAAIIQRPAEISAFDAQFRFRIPAGNGADGFTFGVFDVPYHLGGAGGALGYYVPDLAGRFPSFVVEFDTYQGGSPGETNENHVEIQRFYDINDFVGPSSSDHVPPFDMEDGQWAYCRILMEDGYVSVWMNQTGFDFGVGDLLIASEYLGDVDLSGNGAFDPFFGYFGLTAGTGGLNNQVIIDDLTITLIPEPTSLALLGLGVLALARRRRRA